MNKFDRLNKETEERLKFYKVSELGEIIFRPRYPGPIGPNWSEILVRSGAWNCLLVISSFVVQYFWQCWSAIFWKYLVLVSVGPRFRNLPIMVRSRSTVFVPWSSDRPRERSLLGFKILPDHCFHGPLWTVHRSDRLRATKLWFGHIWSPNFGPNDLVYDLSKAFCSKMDY